MAVRLHGRYAGAVTYRPRATCKRCGASRSAVGHLSRRGNCLDCGIQAEADNAVGIATKTGPAYERWRDAMITAVASLPGSLVIPGTLPDEYFQDARPPAGLITAGG